MPADVPSGPSTTPDRASPPGRRRMDDGNWPAGFVRVAADRDALLVLASLPGVTPRRLRSLALEVGGAAECLSAVSRGHPLVSAADRELAGRLTPRDMLRRLGEVVGAGLPAEEPFGVVR